MSELVVKGGRATGWLWIVLVLNVCDLILTGICLSLGASELSPLVGWWLREGDFVGAGALKIGWVSLLALALWVLSSRVGLARFGLKVCGVALGGVVVYEVLSLVSAS